MNNNKKRCNAKRIHLKTHAKKNKLIENGKVVGLEGGGLKWSNLF